MAQVLHPEPSIEHLNERLALLKGECQAMRENILSQKKQYMNATLQAVAIDIAPVTSIPLVLRHRLKGHRGKIASCDWAANSQHVVSVAMDGLALIWDAYSAFKTRAFVLPNSYVFACALSPAGNYLATGGMDNKISLHLMRSPADELDPSEPESGTQMHGLTKKEPAAVLKGHSAYITDLSYLTDSTLVSSSGDMTCSLWDMNTGRRISTLYDHLGDVGAVAKHPSTPHLFASSSHDKSVKIWDTRLAKCVQTFQGHREDVNAVTFFPDGNAVISGADDSTARLFDCRSDSQMCIFTAPEIVSSINSVSTTNSGRLLICGQESGDVVAWDTIKCKYIGTIAKHGGPVTRVRVSPDGMGVLSSSWDYTMNVLSL